MSMKDKVTIDQLLDSMKKEYGGEPKVMKLLSQLNEAAVFEHATNKNFVMSGPHIPPKYKLLVSIAISAALGSENCTETYTRVARNKGITPEEIMEAILVARFISATTVVNTASSTMQFLLKEDGAHKG